MKDVEVEIFAFLDFKIFEDCYDFVILWLGVKASFPWSHLGMFHTKIRQQKVYICVMFENTFNKCMEEYLLGVVILGE